MTDQVQQETQAQKSTRLVKNPRGVVTIFAQWCKGCRLCVAFCPTQVFTFNDGDERPVVAHPEKCTACHWCDTHCPDLAIVVTGVNS